jgi:hypothetical protein
VKPFGFWTNCACSLAEPPTLSSRSPIRATARHTLVARAGVGVIANLDLITPNGSRSLQD